MESDQIWSNTRSETFKLYIEIPADIVNIFFLYGSNGSNRALDGVWFDVHQTTPILLYIYLQLYIFVIKKEIYQTN